MGAGAAATGSPGGKLWYSPTLGTSPCNAASRAAPSLLLPPRSTYMAPKRCPPPLACMQAHAAGRALHMERQATLPPTWTPPSLLPLHAAHGAAGAQLVLTPPPPLPPPSSWRCNAAAGSDPPPPPCAAAAQPMALQGRSYALHVFVVPAAGAEAFEVPADEEAYDDVSRGGARGGGGASRQGVSSQQWLCRHAMRQPNAVDKAVCITTRHVMLRRPGGLLVRREPQGREGGRGHAWRAGAAPPVRAPPFKSWPGFNWTAV